MSATMETTETMAMLAAAPVAPPATPETMRVGPVTLEGAVVRLEPLRLAHVDALSEVGLDERLWQLTMSRCRTRDDMREFVEDALRLQAAGSALPFVTVERASGRAVGSTRFGNIDRANRRAEIGWTWVAPAWQRTAVNTEAKYLMLRHAFETLGCVRVEFKTDVLNARSRAALLRIGAKEEGILRAHQIVPHTGRLRDSIYFSVIASEWPETRAELERKLGR
jgi:N-acetyltransferase